MDQIELLVKLQKWYKERGINSPLARAQEAVGMMKELEIIDIDQHGVWPGLAITEH